MKNKFAFTQARIKALPRPDKGRVTYYDTEVPKLACRVSSTGNKTYLVIKRFNGKVKTVTLGKTTDIPAKKAQDMARVELSSMAQGIDTTAVKRQAKTAKTTLAQCLEMYIAGKQLKQRTLDDYRYKVHHDLAQWADLPIAKITEKMVAAKHKQLSQVGEAVANNSMVVLRALMNYALAIGILDNNPVTVMSKARIWNKNKRRRGIIQAEQLSAWVEAVLSLRNKKAQLYFLTLLFMGFRSREAIELEWAMIDLEKKTIMALETKNGTDHTLPIPNVLHPYYVSMHETTGHCQWVLPQTTNSDKCIVMPAKPKAAITKATGIKFKVHDLRRTFATIAEAAGIPLSMVSRLMNHSSTTNITTSYIITEEDTLRQAINKVAAYIQASI